METSKPKLKLDYNSAYISINLIDELDYVIGGYGQPTLEFIFSLNTFLESFVLNEQFYLSEKEFRHLQLTSKVLFPNGRPILDLIATEEKKLASISSLGTPMAQVVYLGDVVDEKPETIQKAIELFQNEFTSRIKTDYFVKADLNQPDP